MVSHQQTVATTVRWASCRNILMALICLQMFGLIYIGFSATPVPQHLNDLIGQHPQEDKKELQEKVESQPPKQKEKPQESPVEASSTNASGGGTRGGASVVEQEEFVSDGGGEEAQKGTFKAESEQQFAAIDAGPYDVPGAYYSNFQLQRDRPEFRRVALPGDEKWTNAEQAVSKLVENQPNVKSCYSYDNARRVMTKECQSPPSTGTQQFVAHNPKSAALPRTWCGTSLAPGEAKVVQCDDYSTEAARLYLHDSPPVNGEGMPPIQFIRKDAPASTVVEDLQNCPIPCQVTMDTCPKGKGAECLPAVSDWTFSGTEWQFKFYNRIAGKKVDRKAYRQFQFSASESFKSDVPLSQFEFSILEAPPAVAFEAVQKSIAFVETTACHGIGVRASSWATVMNDKAKLASYCHCEHNTDVPEGLKLSDKEHRQILMKRHMFALVIEESLENDFVSGTVWEALHAGVIPVYYGAGNILDHVPPHSIISANAIGSKDGTAARVMEIANNKTLWETYHAWRKEPFPDALKQKFEFLKTDAYCRVCKWAYAKRYGLGWNHEHQTVEQPVISSRSENMCMSQDGLLVGPFRETWFASSKPDATKTAATTNCEETSRTRTIESDLFTVQRTLSHHDSIVDIVIPEIKFSSQDVGEVVLKLEMPIHNWEGAHFRDVHQLFESQHVAMYSSVAFQDRKSRLTILTNWQTQLRCTTHGTVEVVVQDANEQTLPSGEIRKIRVILEDTSTLRDVMTEYGTSPFAKPLIEDFLDPLELFYIQT